MITTCDRFLGGRLVVTQPARGYRAGTDAVFLAASVPAQPGQKVLDAGSGAGTAALCLAWRVPGCHGVLLEREPSMLDLARLNIRQNGMEDRLQVCQGDIPAARGENLVRRSFDHVMTNPPFFEQGTWFASEAKAHAHHHTRTTLGGWLDFCVRMLCFRGTLTVVHRADHLDRLCHALNTLGVGNLAITPLWPRPGHPAHRILVQGRAGSKGPCRLHPGVCLQDETGAPSPAAEQIARQGMPLLQAQASKKGSAPDI